MTDADLRVEPGEAWLAAASGGGLPEPTRHRWQPLRVGIVDLWEYDDAEFWAADGRLVLRGGNGTGKTKVLELTTLMLLSGEIGASVLDPFGSQHRTMRFNLLPTGEADDPRPPADSGLGYAWVEFGRLDESGRGRYFVCGMGLSARRGSGTSPVVPWHLITSLRPGKDLALRVSDRALDQKELRKLDGVTMPTSAADYRARIADELYGLTPDAYDNLTDLLKQLRRPKLGEKLNPTGLAETLRDALPALAEHELTQLADGWDHLERLRTAVERTEQAAAAVAAFLRTGWRPWARAVLRDVADTFTSATTDLENTTRAKRAAERTLDSARARAEEAGSALRGLRSELRDRNTELRDLLLRPDFQDAVAAVKDVDRMRADLKRARTATRKVTDKVARHVKRVTDARQARDDAETHRGEAAVAVTTAAATVSDSAGSAGLTEAVDRHLVDRDHDALAAAHGVRSERFVRLRHLHDVHSARVKESDRTAAQVRDRGIAVTEAGTAEERARTQVVRGAEELDAAVRSWATLATRVPVPDVEIDQWRDLIPGLTVIDEENGTVDAGPSVLAELHRHLARRRHTTGRRERELHVERAPLVERRDEVRAELDQVRAAIDQPPPPPATWTRRPRPDLGAGQGAPLWRLVDPRPSLDTAGLARVEAALAASGLLDAWVHPDGVLTAVDGTIPVDAILHAGAPRSSSLREVLAPARAGDVDAAIVDRLLGGIGWHPERPGDDVGTWIAADGSWRTGEVTGRAEHLGAASYIGAAARAEARARRIADLESELEQLDARIGELDDGLAELAVDAAETDRLADSLPENAERSLTSAVALLAERAQMLVDARRQLAAAERLHATTLTARDLAWSELATYAAEHRFPVDDIAGQQHALDAFAAAVDQLRSRLEALALRVEVLVGATVTLAGEEAELGHAQDDLSTATEAEHEMTVSLAMAESLLSADGRDLLELRSTLSRRIEQLGEEIDNLQDALHTAEIDAAKAETVVDGHEARRAVEEQKRDAAAQRFWAVVDTGMLHPFEISTPERRHVTAARELAVEVRQRISAPPGDVDRVWRACFDRMQQLRQQLLPDRDAAVRDEDDGPVRIEVLADPAIGWEMPHAAGTTLAERARRQRDGYDAEQQEVLTRLLGSTFIEHLKDRLDHAEHTFARINTQLAAHPTRRGHTLRVQWDAAPTDPDAGAVVAALGRRGYDELSSGDQAMVRGFLARRIEDARAGADLEEAGDWKEQLGEALDYRRWLTVSLQYRAGAGANWVAFDVARHGVKSGGEKVVLLSQPLFAAAVVAYDAAGPHAPRWVWLDEAMTGVDAEVKASFMGLTVELGLDIMLTAHDEWCTYPTVPAVAIYDLARNPHLPGVDVDTYLWCGGDLARIEGDGLGHRPEAAVTTSPEDSEQFGFDLG